MVTRRALHCSLSWFESRPGLHYRCSQQTGCVCAFSGSSRKMVPPPPRGNAGTKVGRMPGLGAPHARPKTEAFVFVPLSVRGVLNVTLPAFPPQPPHRQPASSARHQVAAIKSLDCLPGGRDGPCRMWETRFATDSGCHSPPQEVLTPRLCSQIKSIPDDGNNPTRSTGPQGCCLAGGPSVSVKERPIA
jgi:hypothetical protein